MSLAVLLAQTSIRTAFEFGRIQTEGDWIAPALMSIFVVTVVTYLYRRDARELPRWLAAVLIGLRVVAFLGLLVIYLQPQWRNQRQVVRNSRVLVAVDTSLSMDVDDHDASPTEPNRAQQVAGFLADGKFLGQLRQKHDVVVLRFDEGLSPIATLAKLPPTGQQAPAEVASPGAKPGQRPATDTPLDWQRLLAPRGTETRLGQALRQLVLDQRTSPVSGIVLLTDGQQNAGLEPAAAGALAREAQMPVFPIGIGSNKLPANVRVADFQVPIRVYPGDRYEVTGFLQAQGMSGKTVRVELLSHPPGEGDAQRDTRLESTTQVTLGDASEMVPVRFELASGEVGRRVLVLRVIAPPEDRTADDNRREAAVDVVERKNHVLLFAGGPTREYQFLRNLLKRDKQTVVDVLLQTGSDGVSQDAQRVLEIFPATRKEMYDYDCLVAFDPDWRNLSPTQIDLLERWVAEQAGGLIVVAGPVYTDLWSAVPTLGRIRGLYPVEFQQRFADLAEARFGSQEPWPIEFTREGLEAPFLWLADSPAASAAIWERFQGVFGYYGVRGPKPGATVYARYSDPRSAVSGQLPIYWCGQFYGSGRVFFQASGEIWRLRRVGDSFFEMFYTKLIRHVSQGRLQRGSNRGVLLTDRDHYMPGETVEVRAQLSTAQLEPLELPSVTAQAIGPGGWRQPVKLAADGKRPGSYRGELVVTKEGSYRLELTLVDGGEERLATPPLQVTIPDLERIHVERNDALLSELARQTGGDYYIGLASALTGKPGAEPLGARLADRSRTMTLAAAPDPVFNDTAPWHRVRWLLGGLCGVLFVEWLIRRLVKLA